MRTLKFLNCIFFIGLLAFGCGKVNLPGDLIYPDNILGDWDIEGGGTLFFEAEKFSASAGCNTLFGSFTVEENRIIFSMLASTLIGCPEPEGSREQELAALLDSARLTYEIEGNQARLLNSENKVVLTLNRPLNAALVNAWKLTSIRTENAISSSILDKESGITFKADGTLSIETACNSGGGTYSTKDQALTPKELYFTEMGCEQERMTREEEFRQALTQINSYSILRETLTLEKDGTVYLTLQLDE